MSFVNTSTTLCFRFLLIFLLLLNYDNFYYPSFIVLFTLLIFLNYIYMPTSNTKIFILFFIIHDTIYIINFEGVFYVKRLDNLYETIYNYQNINNAFDEICQKTKNKNKVGLFKEYKCIYIARIYSLLKNRAYTVGPYNVFYIYEPKKRRIVSQCLIDKIINHLVAKYILYPSILPCLIDTNVASRKNMGTKKGIQLARKYQRQFGIKYHTYYILKIDIHHFFGSINHNVLKNKLRKKIKDPDALNILFQIIDSDDIGLSIGNMTSQILAIFFLNDLDHFIKETLHIKRICSLPRRYVVIS